MAAVTVRNLDDRVKERLRLRAASHGRSMEAEIRAILAQAVSDPDDDKGLLITLLERFAGFGGVELGSLHGPNRCERRICLDDLRPETLRTSSAVEPRLTGSRVQLSRGRVQDGSIVRR